MYRAILSFPERHGKWRFDSNKNYLIGQNYRGHNIYFHAMDFSMDNNKSCP